jgi:hypothetical protein
MRTHFPYTPSKEKLSERELNELKARMPMTDFEFVGYMGIVGAIVMAIVFITWLIRNWFGV